MEPLASQSAWLSALEQLKRTVDADSFATWIEPTRLHSMGDSRVVLDVPSPVFKSWLIANYREKIVRALRDVTREEYELEFQVSSGITVDAAAVQHASGGMAGAGQATTPQVSQPLKSSTLNTKYTFDDFVVGENNRFAHAASRQVADPNSKSYNPLFIYGGVGLGKTHLMHAVGHQLLENNTHARVLYVTSEQFMNSFIEAISEGRQFEFRDYYRNVDLLLIDDVQFFTGKERTQTEFFHTFNALYDAGKKIVVSSDRPPRELTTLEDRLRNRFSWGLVVDIQPPDLETRMAILKRKAQADGTEIPVEVTVYIAERVSSNIRELEGVLIRLKAYAALHREPVSLELAQRVLGHLIAAESPRLVALDDVIEEVCNYFEISRSELTGSSRLKKFSMPRHIAQYLTRKLTGHSFPEIARRFGGRDHTSILHACRKIEETAEKDENLSNLLTYLTKRIRDDRPTP